MQPHISDTVFKVLSAAGTILGVWAIIRSYWLTRSKLVLRQKADKGHNKFMDQGEQGAWMLKVLISNMSNQGNSVVRWKAWMKDKNGDLRVIRVPQGKVTDSKTGVVDSVFNATPINVLPPRNGRSRVDVLPNNNSRVCGSSRNKGGSEGHVWKTILLLVQASTRSVGKRGFIRSLE
jgi:hypothetical protein